MDADPTVCCYYSSLFIHNTNKKAKELLRNMIEKMTVVNE